MTTNKKVILLSSLTVSVLSGLGYLAVNRLKSKREESYEEESK